LQAEGRAVASETPDLISSLKLSVPAHLPASALLNVGQRPDPAILQLVDPGSVVERLAAAGTSK